MTRSDDGWWRAFVEELPARTAKLAVIRTDGSPQVVPVWAALDGDDVVFTTMMSSLKGRAIRRDPRVSLCWDDDRPPFHFVTVNGRARTSDDPEDVLEWATRIGGRYMGKDRAEEFGRRNAVPGEMVVRVRPDRVIAHRNVSD